MHKLAILIHWFLLFEVVYLDYYSSIGHMEALVKEEDRIIGKYGNELSHIIHKINLHTTDRNVKNPLAAFKLLRRFIKYWKPFLNESKEELGVWYLVTENDVIGSVDAIFRLQDVYDLKTIDLLRGIIAGEKYEIRFTMEDCFEISKRASVLGRYLYYDQWITATYNSTHSEDYCSKIEPLDLINIYEYVVWIKYLFENHEFAINLTHQLLNEYPDNSIAQEYYKFYQNSILNGNKDIRMTYALNDVIYTKNIVQSRHSKNCRNELITHENNDILTCWFRFDGSLIEKFIPKKIVQFNKNPDIFIFKSVISDAQINRIIEISLPNLNRATIVNPATQVQEPASYRVSKSVWLEEFDPVIADINELSGQLTGLALSTAELLQIANYGLGGQYDYHFDHGSKNSKMETGVNGNRLATLLYYLTDVKYGGATVFEHDGLYVTPNKGDAILWFNLYRNGSGNWLTRHASCPVSIGDKWVANKWFHFGGNELKRKCSLYEEE